jgi:hypothetical protein
MMKMTNLTVIASVARFVQENQMALLAVGNEIVILNPQQARAVLEVLIGAASAPPRKRKGARKPLPWQPTIPKTARRISFAMVERLVKSGNRMAFNIRSGMKASGFVSLW